MKTLSRHLILLLLLCTAQNLFAQRRHRTHDDVIKDASYGDESMVDSTSVTGNSHLNDCAEYYDRPGDSTTVPFKSVMVTTYKSEDSNMTDKKVTSKAIKYFNKKGLVLFDETIDDDGKISDSTRTIYDNKDNIIREIDYERSEKGKMKKSSDETMAYDVKGELIKDISMEIDPDDNSIDKTAEYTKYDTAGNVIQKITYTESDDEGDKDKDTSITTSKYDDHKRLIYSQTKTSNFTSSEYHG